MLDGRSGPCRPYPVRCRPGPTLPDPGRRHMAVQDRQHPRVIGLAGRGNHDHRWAPAVDELVDLAGQPAPRTRTHPGWSQGGRVRSLALPGTVR